MRELPLILCLCVGGAGNVVTEVYSSPQRSRSMQKDSCEDFSLHSQPSRLRKRAMKQRRWAVFGSWPALDLGHSQSLQKKGWPGDP